MIRNCIILYDTRLLYNCYDLVMYVYSRRDRAMMYDARPLVENSRLENLGGGHPLTHRRTHRAILSRFRSGSNRVYSTHRGPSSCRLISPWFAMLFSRIARPVRASCGTPRAVLMSIGRRPSWEMPSSPLSMGRTDRIAAM